MTSKAKLLVTGAAGFIGSHLCERLCAAGHEVTGLDSFDTFLYDAASKERNVARLADTMGFTLVRGNLLDRELVSQLCAARDVVVHLASLAGVRPSLADPPRYARTNLEGTLHVLEGCRAAGVARVVFASSSSVYGARPVGSAGFREDDPCLRPASPYGATKRAGELLCSTYRDLYGIGITALRFFTVYGPRQRPDMAIHKFARAIAAGQPVTVYGDGSTQRDYTYIDDIIDGVVAAFERVSPGAFEIYNLGGSRTTGLATLVEVIGRALGTAPRVIHEPEQPGDVPTTFADVSKAARDLGFSPQVGVEDGVARFVDWLRAQPSLGT
jgi:UDP-glucuronate 4-epimerase